MCLPDVHGYGPGVLQLRGLQRVGRDLETKPTTKVLMASGSSSMCPAGG